MARIKTNIFFSVVLENIPRLLGQLNRNPCSSAYGSFDRAFWHYRTNDISSARYQEAALTLALIYTHDVEGNAYWRDPVILEWINAALEFTVSIQESDGSFSEWYVHEGSFVATAFVLAALSDVLLLLGKEKICGYKNVLYALEKGGRWLLNRDEGLVRNQSAGAAYALVNLWKLSGDKAYRDAAEKMIRRILGDQTDEGWWSEYGGPDIGYLSLMLDYLAKVNGALKSAALDCAMERATGFLSHFLHPNFTAGGEYMARNTEYLIPSGFALRQAEDPAAKRILWFIAESLQKSAGVSPFALDDRYLCYILYNWFQAGLSYRADDGWSEAMHEFVVRRADVFFPLCGIRVFQNEKYYFVANLYKGGVFRMYARNGNYIDCGVEAANGTRRHISGVLDYENAVVCDGMILGVRGALKTVDNLLMRTPVAIVFKMYQMTVGRMAWFRAFVKEMLRWCLVLQRRKSENTYERKFILDKNSVIVEDTVAGVAAASVRFGVKASYNFIPSAKYFAPQELSEAKLIASQRIDETMDGINSVRTLVAE